MRECYTNSCQVGPIKDRNIQLKVKLRSSKRLHIRLS